MNLRSALLETIKRGRLAPGARLPSEHALCRAHGVSRTVVWQALGQLAAERRIYSVRGNGTFVAHEKATDDFTGTDVGLSGEMIARGLRVTNRVLESGLGAATTREARRLGMAEGRLCSGCCAHRR